MAERNRGSKHMPSFVPSKTHRSLSASNHSSLHLTVDRPILRPISRPRQRMEAFSVTVVSEVIYLSYTLWEKV
jgi:hypothetical protein